MLFLLLLGHTHSGYEAAAQAVEFAFLQMLLRFADTGNSVRVLRDINLCTGLEFTPCIGVFR